MVNTILKLPQVKNKTTLARSTIYLRISEGTFPKQIKIGVRAVGWLESDIEDWIQSRIDESRKGDK